MPASLHELLVDGADVIRSLLLPIGAYNEEAQESRNKHIRWYRLKHARKTSPRDTLTDQFNHLCVTSDPVITRIIQRDVEAKQRSRKGGVKRGDEELNVLLESDTEPPEADEQDQTSFDSDSSLASEEGPYHLSDDESSGEDDTEGSYSLPDYYYECP